MMKYFGYLLERYGNSYMVTKYFNYLEIVWVVWYRTVNYFVVFWGVSYLIMIYFNIFFGGMVPYNELL